MRYLTGCCAALLFLTLPAVASGQAVLGARPVALGQASVALARSEWSLFANPAMMDPEAKSLSMFGIRYYGLAEITDMAAALTWAAPFGVAGFGVHRYGFELFHENRIRLALRQAAGDFWFGGALNYTHVSQGGGYGSAGALGIDLGIGAALPGHIRMGARVVNVNRPELGASGEELPGAFAIGFSYLAADRALFLLEAVKDVRFPLSWRSGLEVRIFGGFEGRAGVSTEPLTLAGGFGYRAGFGAVNVAAQHHTQLGISPGLDVTVRL